jgi:hypothetical protein
MAIIITGSTVRTPSKRGEGVGKMTVMKLFIFVAL